jgi:preprotein translocase subunit SecD
VKLEFRLAESQPGDGLTEAEVVGFDQKVYLHKTVELTNTDIDKANPGLGTDEKPEILLKFTKAGAEKMAKLCEAHRGKLLAILADGKVLCAPVLRGKVTGHAAIRGSFTFEDVERIAKGINGD